MANYSTMPQCISKICSSTHENTRAKRHSSNDNRACKNCEDRNLIRRYNDEHNSMLHHNHKNNYLIGHKIIVQNKQSDSFAILFCVCSSLQYSFLRLQPSKVLIFIFFLLSLFLFCVESAPARKNNSVEAMSGSKLTNFALKSELYRHNSPYYFEGMEKANIFPTISRIKRSSLDSTLDVPKTAKRKNRKSKKSKSSNEKQKRKKNRKTKRRTRKPVAKAAFPTNIMLKIPRNSRQREIKTSLLRRQRLYNNCGNSFHLAVWKNGTVGGEPSNLQSNYSILELGAIEGDGTVTIKGYHAKKYICVTRKGIVRAKKKYKKALCRFKERVLSNNQNSYESLSCSNCFLNLNNNGKIRRLKKVNFRLVQAQFLPRDPSRLLAAHREGEISIDFSKLNETDFFPDSFSVPDKNGNINRLAKRLPEKAEKHNTNPERGEFLRHSKPKHRSSNLQKDTDNKTIIVRKIPIKSAAKID